MTSARSLIRRIPGASRVLRRFDAAIVWRIDARVAGIEAQLREVDERARWTAGEVARIAPDIAALEVRLATLQEQLSDDRLEAAPESEARTALAGIRAEHERVRVRLQAVSQYEERLRRLEEAQS